MPSMIRTCFLLTALVTLPGADNWERFRGPNGSGTVDDKSIPVTFGTSDHVVWRFALEGAGNSSPIIWGNRLFLHATAKDGTRRSLLCLDTADGKLLWERSINAEFAKIRADSSMASSTPTTDGETIYVSFWNGDKVLLTAFDFQGKQRWQTDLGTFNSQHGPGASPVLYENTLLLANDMDKDDFTTKVPNPRPSFLMVFDKRTGKLLWETPRGAERTCYSSPIFRKRPGKADPELIITSSTAVTGYDLKSGSKIWEAKGWQEKALKNPMRTVATPALLGDLLCVTCGGDAGRYAIGLELPTAGEKEPKLLWENRKDFPYVASPLARGEHFYFVNDAGNAGCYEARSGKRVWFERISDAGFHSSPLLIDGKIYAGNSAGDVFVFPAEPTYRLLARNELGEPIRATPAVAGRRLYIRGEQHLFCIGK